MNLGKGLSVLTIVVYTILANIIAGFLKIHWVHVFNGLILMSILYHLLQWKYDWVEEEDNDKMEETT